LEQVNFDHLRSHADGYKTKFDKKVFGGNEFRVIAIVNAISEGAPSYAVRAFEFHDHYCPGVTSGIIMDASTIVYRKKKDSKNWEGIVLAFKWADTRCPETGNGVVDKVCADLWYVKHMETPEDFVSVVKSFELPEGASPKDWAGPGVNYMEKIGMVR